MDVDGGASCHVGYRSCFYRSVPFGKDIDNSDKIELKFEEKEKVFEFTNTMVVFMPFQQSCEHEEIL